jgi:hypothetical protein
VTGNDYKRLIARYVLSEYAPRGIRVYDEVRVGTTIIGKQRRVDLFLVHPDSGGALGLECKYQDSSGTADEKIPYALRDLAALRMPAAVVYAGAGFSEGVLHLLQSSEFAAYCLPDDDLRAVSRKGDLNSGTWQLDHLLAVTFHWWDLLVGDKRPLQLNALNGLEPETPRPLGVESRG